MIGILSVGAYAPRARLQRAAVVAAHAWFAPGMKALGKGERATANWDEDAITMAVEAGRDCLEGRDRTSVTRILLASSSLPFLDRQNVGVVKEALDLPDAVAALDVAGSQRAATSALLDAIYAVRGGAGTTLCLAAEKRRAQPASEQELVGGDAAVGLLLGEGDLAAEFLSGHSMTVDFVDHFRAQGHAFDYGWESRWIRDEGFAKVATSAVNAALDKCGLKAGDIDRFLMGAPMKGVNDLVAKACGIAPAAVADPLTETLGDAGGAQPLILLAHALETAKADEILMVVGFGQGCDVLIFRATGNGRPAGLGVSGWLARRRPEANYVKYLALNGHLQLELGMRAEFDQKTALTALYRNRKAILGLVGSRCSKTGTVQFPPSQISVAPNDRARGTQERYPLADRVARILTYTSDSLAFSPDPPVYYGAIEFDGGGRMTAEFAEADADSIVVGAAMRMMFRIKAIDGQRGFTRYFWKAVPDYRAAQPAIASAT